VKRESNQDDNKKTSHIIIKKTKMEKTIAIITCWYGPYPWYFSYFIRSCEYNPTVDFIIVTDNQELIPDKPNNVKIIHKPFDELRADFSERLEFPVNLEFPYKLCDFKPAYGYLFPDIVEKYDFWGMGDLDIVYGDIRAFMTDEILNTYDIVNSRHDFISGTFCLFRNNEYINTLFKQSKDYKSIFSTSVYGGFDECSFLFIPISKEMSIFDFPDSPESIMHVIKKAEIEGKLKAFFDFIVLEGLPGKISWTNGKIYYKDIFEAMFYNLIKFKVACKKQTKFNPIPDTLYFTPSRILARLPK